MSIRGGANTGSGCAFFKGMLKSIKTPKRKEDRHCLAGGVEEATSREEKRELRTQEEVMPRCQGRLTCGRKEVRPVLRELLRGRKKFLDR